MKSEKGLKKFNISNKLAYTLMVILSIILLGIGVFAYGGTVPTTMGHSAGELNLDWGASSLCTGTATACHVFDFNQPSCDSQDGCYYGCTGGEFTITCSMLDAGSCSSLSGCWYDGMSCTGWTEQTLYCSDFSEGECENYLIGGRAVFTPCYMGCAGEALDCPSYSPATCTTQAGCSVTQIQRTITPSTKGINIPSLNVNYLCDLAGNNCVSVKSSITSSDAYFNTGADSARREMRRGAYVSCPSGTYLYRVQVVDGGGGVEAWLEGDCRTLPIQ